MYRVVVWFVGWSVLGLTLNTIYIGKGVVKESHGMDR